MASQPTDPIEEKPEHLMPDVLNPKAPPVASMPDKSKDDNEDDDDKKVSKKKQVLEERETAAQNSEELIPDVVFPKAPPYASMPDKSNEDEEDEDLPFITREELL